MPQPQTYANHVQRPRLWSLAFMLAVVALALLLVEVWRTPSAGTVALALLAVAVVFALGLLRLFVTRLQDRIIRLEMQVRLARLGRADDLPRASLRQLIALRFASDQELPALLDRAIAEQLSSDDIKRAVRDWQPDLHRV